MVVTSFDRTDARPTPPRPQPRRRERKKIGVGRVLGWVALVAVMAATIFPFWWVLRTGLSNNNALAAGAGSLLPADFTFGGVRRALGVSTVAESQAESGSLAPMNFWTYLRNSVVVCSLITAGQVFFSAMAAYAFARLRWPGREQVFFVFLLALMIPPIFTFLPNFVLIKQLGLLNTYAGLVAPFVFMTPFAVFFMRQFFLGISREVEEAAMIDGAGHFRIFARIILPMSSAPLTTLAILTYIMAWNEYLWPLMVGSEDNARVLTVALGYFRQQSPGGLPDWAGLMAATFLAALPVIALFLIFGKKIVNSIQFSGLK